MKTARAVTQEQRMRRAWLVLTLAALGGLLPGGLAACTQDSSRPPVAQATSTPTSSAPTVSVLPTSAATLAPTSTPASHTLSVAFSVHITVVNCSGSRPAGTLCINVTGNGTAGALGAISVSRTAILSPPGDDSCGPSTTTGKLTTAGGDTVTFNATGQFCRATSTARYTYTVTGGTGRYRHATGTGSMEVPRLTDSTSPRETWSGTLIPGA
jgi:hypothetical protein